MHGAQRTKTAKPTTWGEFSAAFHGENTQPSNQCNRQKKNSSTMRTKAKRKQKKGKQKTHAANIWASKGHTTSANKAQNLTTKTNDDANNMPETRHALTEPNMEMGYGLTEQSMSDRDFALALQMQMQQALDATPKPSENLSQEKRNFPTTKHNPLHKPIQVDGLNRKQRKWLRREGQLAPAKNEESLNARKQKKQQIKMTWGNFRSAYGKKSGPNPDAWNRQDLSIEVDGGGN